MTTSSGVTRRRFVAGTALSVSAILLAACGSQPSAPTAAPPAASGATAPTATPAPAAAAPTATVAASPTPAAQTAPQTAGGAVVWSCYTLGEARNAILQDLAKKAADKAGLKVDLKIEPGDHYWDNLQMRYTGGGAPDVVVNQVNWIQPGAARGVFVALDSYMDQDKVKREDYNDYKSWLYQGKIYGLPFQALGENVYLNTKLFKEAGLELPKGDWDWKTCLDLATKLTKGDGPGKTYGLHYGYLAIEVNLGSFILNNGGKVLNETRDKALYGDDPKAIEAAQWVVDTMLKSKVAPTPAATQGQPNPITTGKVAIEIYSFFFVANVQKGIGDENMALRPIPKGPDGSHSMAVGSNAWSIVGSSKVRDQAWKLINWLEGTEGQTIWAPGGTPALNSVAKSETYLKLYPNQKEDLKLILDQWNKDGRDYFITVDTDDWWKTADTNLTPMYTGEKSVPEAMKASADAVNTQVFAKRQKM